MKTILLFTALFIDLNLTAQNKFVNHFSIGTNLFSLSEPHTGLGVCVGYKYKERFGFWSETTFMFNTEYIINEWKNFKGFRYIIQPRYYLNNRKNNFIAVELRYKNSTFNSKLNYFNKITKDSLLSFVTNENQKIFGGAIILGKTISLSKYFFIEITAGFGARQRNIKRKNLPLGYEYFEIERYTREPSFYREEYFERNKGQGYYLPIGIRFMWKIKSF